MQRGDEPHFARHDLLQPRGRKSAANERFDKKEKKIIKIYSRILQKKTLFLRRNITIQMNFLQKIISFCSENMLKGIFNKHLETNYLHVNTKREDLSSKSVSTPQAQTILSPQTAASLILNHDEELFRSESPKVGSAPNQKTESGS